MVSFRLRVIDMPLGLFGVTGTTAIGSAKRRARKTKRAPIARGPVRGEGESKSQGAPIVAPGGVTELSS
jgi:hypothetical protein